MKKKIYLNAGHGGIHPITKKYCTFPTDGKFYTFAENGITAYEGQTNRIFANLFGVAMIGTDIEIVQTHHNFWDRANQDRLARANLDFTNTKPDKALWLSWHSNAVGMQSTGKSLEPRGYSIYTSQGNTQADDCATLIFNEQRKATAKFGVTFRQDLQDGQPDYDINFEELAYSKMPAVLIENLFFTNYEDYKLLLNSEYQLATVQATKKAVLEWFNKVN